MWGSFGEAGGAVVPKMYSAVDGGFLLANPAPSGTPTPTPFLLPFAVCDMWIPLVIDVTLTLWAPAVCLDVTM